MFSSFFLLSRKPALLSYRRQHRDQVFPSKKAVPPSEGGYEAEQGERWQRCFLVEGEN